MKKSIASFLFFAFTLTGVSVSWAISWESDMDLALEKAKNSGQAVMADFYTDWCHWCKKLDKNVYTDPEVGRLAEKFICVKVNCETDKSAFLKYGLRGYPTIIFFNSQAGVEKMIIGYKPAQVFVDDMNEVLAKISRSGALRQQAADKPLTGPETILPYPAAENNADTLYLNNGRHISGIISKEDASNVELQTDGGSVVISRAEIKTIRHAPSGTIAGLKDRLEERRTDLEAGRENSNKERKERSKAYEDWVNETSRNKTQVRKEGEVSIKRDPESQSVLVDAVLNGDVNALLVVDTGASIVVLSKNIGEKMGLDLVTDKGDFTTLHLAGGQTARAKGVILKSVNIDGVEEKGIQAAVLAEDKGNIGFKDGLLGRSFLGRFNMKIDLQKMKMALQKLNSE